MPLIETVDLCQKRDDKYILNNVNLGVERGEVFAVIGPTGAGKTTLLRLIDLLEEPTSGKIFFAGTDVTQPGSKRLDIQRRMGFVLQKPVVFNASVYDNIAYGLKWRGEGREYIHRKVNDILKMVDMVEYGERNARTLSGGEMQRVAIARAIVSEPEVLLLDEPTANLDPVSSSRIEALIADIIHRYHTTIIMATHDMSQGQRLADKVCVLLDGRIVQSGDWQGVFNTPRDEKVAAFVGVENIIVGTIASNENDMVAIDIGGDIIEAIADYPMGEKVSACIRPEDITLTLSKTSSSARNSFAGTVSRVISAGALSRVELDCGFPLVCLVTKKSAEELNLESGKQVHASFKATGVHVIGRELT